MKFNFFCSLGLLRLGFSVSLFKYKWTAVCILMYFVMATVKKVSPGETMTFGNERDHP